MSLQKHSPALQYYVSDLQALPHLPQLLVSKSRLKHEVPHKVSVLRQTLAVAITVIVCNKCKSKIFILRVPWILRSDLENGENGRRKTSAYSRSHRGGSRCRLCHNAPTRATLL